MLQLATSCQCLLLPLHRGARCLPRRFVAPPPPNPLCGGACAERLNHASRSLEALLADAAVVKAGVGIEGDALRLAAGHGVVLKGQLDVRALSPRYQSLSLAALSHGAPLCPPLKLLLWWSGAEGPSFVAFVVFSVFSVHKERVVHFPT